LSDLQPATADYVYNLSARTAVHVIKRDITELDVDVLVSSDDTRLSMGGGVSGRIRRQAGKVIFDRVSLRTGKTFQEVGRVAVGEIFASPGGRLKAQKVFQTAVVDWEQISFQTDR